MSYEFKASDVYDFARFIGAETKEKGDELFFKHCPRCNGGNHDTETFSVNFISGAFKCFRASCGYEGHFVQLARDFGFPLEDEADKTYRRLPQKIVETRPKAVEYFATRGIGEETVKKYRITTRKDNDNIIVFPFYDENNVLQFVKYRKTNFNKTKDKNKEWCEADTKPILFGMAQCEDFSQLVITEGQIDSLSVAECGIKNAVSVPTGAKGFTWLQHCWDWINQFEEIVVFGDCENGKITLIDELSRKLKTMVKCVQKADYLCEKDANAILTKYGKEAVIKAVEGATIAPIQYVNRLAEVKSVNLMDMPKIKTNIRSIDKAIGGLYYGQVILLTGQSGNGKSCFLSQLIAEALEQNVNTFVYSGELSNAHFKNWIDLQIAGEANIVGKENSDGDMYYYVKDEAIEKINKWYYDKMFIFDNSAVEDDEFKGILHIIEDSICRYGIRLVCIDNLMTAISDDPKTEVYRQQSIFVKALKRIARKYEIVVILVAHPKKSKEEFSNDTVSGSADITNAADVVMNYQRTKENEEFDADSKIMITKNRLTGKLLAGESSVLLRYSEKSRRIYGIDNYNPYKQYSCFNATKKEEIALDEGLPF